MVGIHNPTGGFRGGKYSAFEGGTRVPTIVCWKGRVAPSASNALISQVDLLSSIASLVGEEVNSYNLDSRNYLSAWLGTDDKGRDALLEESSTLAVRKGGWKYIKPFEGQTSAWMADKGIESGLSSEAQLFNLTEDPKESNNIASKFPEKTKELDQWILELTSSKMD